MAQYKTPGVYVEEKSTISPSVAGVETAIPAFIGFTEKGPKNTPTAITSLLDYQGIFGKGKALSVNEEKKVCGQEYALFDSLRLFYDNGGADCYVVSIGNYKDPASSITAQLYKDAIDTLDKPTDVTILLFPDAATLLADESALAEVQQYALKNCAKHKSRFAILDLFEQENLDTTLEKFREGVAVDSTELSYGAAYYPYLRTSYVKDIPFEEVFKAVPVPTDEDDLEIYNEAAKLINPEPEVDEDGKPIVIKEKDLKISAISQRLPGYAETLAALQDDARVIPPSGAIAGIYAATDKRVGVWQAPANTGVASVKGLCQLLTDDEQGKMNVDPLTNKSVNAIRFFKGKGILVWGSRTLNGGSREWRYIPVRRLFNYIEQSVKLATHWVVFQPNDANTWTKIKCQISNFLNTLWRDGALATPYEAFFVEVGKNVTMTPEDIEDGYLIVRIGLAAVRPAEFIVLEFSHKVQE